MLLVAGLVVATLTACTHTGTGALDAQKTSAEQDCIVVQSERFVFHNDPWINLHHFLFEWARNVPERRVGDRRRAVDVVERTQLGRLSDAERQAWEKAVRFYRDRLVERDLTFDRDHIALRGELGAIACSAERTPLRDTELSVVLSEAMDVYRRHWWREHRARNAEWMKAQSKALRVYEARLAMRLAAAYGGEWPSERVRVDVTAYASWPGAYTTNRPNQLTVSSVAFQRLEALEILFHEVSHAAFFEQKLFGDVAAAFRDNRVPGDLTDLLVHAIQFATPAEILRSELEGTQRKQFVSVGELVAARGRMQRLYPIVIEHWKPFLEGRTERAVALERIATALR